MINLNRVRFILLQSWRQKINPEFKIFAFALAIAVMSMTALITLTKQGENLLVQEGASLLGGNLLLESATRIPPKLLLAAKKQALKTSEMVEFFSMLGKGEQFQLGNVLAFYQAFPLAGKLIIQDAKAEKKAFAPPNQGEMWLDSSLQNLLKLQLGDLVSIGNTSLKVTAWIKERPVATSTSGALAPQVYVNAKDLDAMQVLQSGSRATYRLVLKGEPLQLNRFKSQFVNEPNLQWISEKEGRRGVNRTFNMAGSYLNLILFVQIVLASLVIALCAHQTVSRQTREVALWRTLGASIGQYLKVNFAIILIFATTIMLIAAGLGLVLAYLASTYAKTLGLSMMSFTLEGAFIALAIGFLMLLGFALPPFLQLKNVQAVRILQQSEGEISQKSVLISAVAFVGIGILFSRFFQHNELLQRLAVQTSILGAFVFVLAYYLWYGFSPLSKRGPLSWRLGLGYLVRHKAQAIAQWLIFTLVLMLLLLVLIIQKDFMSTWQKQLPKDTPNYFLVNIQSEQVAPLKKWFSNQGLKEVTFYPIVPGRLSHINGQSLDEKSQGKIARPLNLTWSPTPQKGLSIESSFAQRQNLHVGDTLSFEVGENTVSEKITDIRNVNWGSFKPNFFVVFPPDQLETFPHSYITSIYLAKEKKPILYELVKDYIEISIIDIEAILLKVREMIDKLALVLEGLLVLVFLLGVLIFYANLLSTLKERLQESAMLQILGANKRLILKMLAVEFLSIGFLAGFVASLLALLLAQDVAENYFAIDFHFSTKWLITGMLMGMGLMIGLGLLGARAVLKVSPLHLLRNTA